MSSFHGYMAKRATSGLVDIALAFGLPVFPCAADKKPVTEHGFKDASMDPDEVRRMFTLPGTALIGLPTGEITGIVVVDVDVKDSRQGMDWLNANSHRMPQTRTIRTGSGGLHIYLKWPGQRVKNTQSKIAPGIDTRGDGGYVIAGGSPGYTVADDAPVAEVPDWLLPALCPLEPVRVAAAPVSRKAPRLDGGSAYGLAGLGRECEAIRMAWDGAKHAAVNKAGYSIGGLVAVGELQESAAFAELSDALRDIESACKDFKAAQRTLAVSFRAGMAQPRAIAAFVAEPIHPAAVFMAKEQANHAARVAAKALPIAPALMDVDGVLGMFMAHCARTAISPQPFLALAAGICVIGALAGRRYRTRTNLRTNIYAVGIADSGAGKDHARKVTKAILGKAGLTRYIGGEDIASGAAMFTALQRHPVILFQIDEFGDWLASVLGKNAASHKKQIAERLRTLYSSADSYIAGTEYANQKLQDGRPRQDIQEPHACLYGTTTPGQFWAAIEGASMHDGLLARVMLFVSADSYPDERDAEPADVPDELVAAFQAIAAGAEGHDAGNLASIMSGAVAGNPYLVPASAEAERAIKALRAEQLAMQRRAAGTYVTSIAARWAENAVKLALVRAVSHNPAHPSITTADVAWGRALARHCINTLLQDAERHVADSQYETNLNRAREIIRKHGPLTERDMIRRGFKLTSRDRADVIKTLVDGGLVVEIPTQHEGVGRPTMRYAIAGAPNAASDTMDCGTDE